MTPNYLVNNFSGALTRRNQDLYWAPTLAAQNPQIPDLPLGNDSPVVLPGVFARYSLKGQANGVGAAITSNILNVSAGDFLTVMVSHGDDSDATAWTLSNTGSAITWTQVVSIGAAGNCKVVLWKGVAGATPPTTVTVTVTAGSLLNGSKVMAVGAYTGYDQVDPLPAAKLTSGISGTDVSQSITPSAIGSALQMFAADWSQTNSFGVSSVNRLSGVYDESGIQTAALIIPKVQPRPDASPFTIGETDTSGTISWIAFEVKVAGAAGQTGIANVVTRVGSKANVTTFSKSGGAAGTEFNGLRNTAPSLKLVVPSSAATKAIVRSSVTPAKLMSYATNTVMAFRSTVATSHMSLVTVLERAVLRSQVLFTKIGASSEAQSVATRTQAGGLKTGIAATLESALARFTSLASALGQAGTGSAINRSNVRMVLSAGKIGIVDSVERLNFKGVTTAIRTSVGAVLEKLTERNASTGIKIGIVSTVTRTAPKNQLSITRISTSGILALLSLRGQLSTFKRAEGPVITLLKSGGVNAAGKVTIVIVSSAAQAAALRQVTLASKVVSIAALQQIPLYALTGAQKQAVAATLVGLGLNWANTGANLQAAVVGDPCAGSSMLDATLNIVNRLEGEVPTFVLCGGRDRFEFEETTAYNELRRRGLI